MVGKETIMINIDTRCSECSIKDSFEQRHYHLPDRDTFPSEDLDSSQEEVASCPLF